MSQTNYRTVDSSNSANLDEQVEALQADGWVTNGPLVYARGRYAQSLVKGDVAGTFEDLTDRTTDAEAAIAALQADNHTGVAVTATVGGGTTGLIPATAAFATVTSDNADKQISLPAATVGKKLRLLVTGAACELISAVAAHKVNNVTVGATNEAALVQDALYDCEYVATNLWIVTGKTKLGAAIAAIVPDSL